MEFPKYVKYSNQKHFFKIISNDCFEELMIYPKAYSLIAFEAKTFVDRNVISDLLLPNQTHVQSSSKQEFEDKLKELKAKGVKQLS